VGDVFKNYVITGARLLIIDSVPNDPFVEVCGRAHTDWADSQVDTD